jgi:hypothetical protein
MSDLPPPPSAGPGGQDDVDMEIEEGELPSEAPPPPRPAAAGLMPPPPPVAAAGGPGGWYGGVAVSAVEEKWRPQRKELSAQTKALLKSMGEDAYGEFFPETGGAAPGSDDEAEEEGGGKKKGAAAAAEGGEGSGAKGPAKPGAMTDERRREQKLDGQLGKIKQLFQDKGFGNEAAFKKPEKLEVAATPARKRPRI